MVASHDNGTAHRLLSAAECLFAEEGVDAVSTRRISVAAGQRNTSSLQYHFGNKEALLEALLESRQGPINRRRQILMAQLQAAGQLHNLASLVDAMVRPFVELLGGSRQDSYYLSLVSQLHSHQRLGLLFDHEHERGESLRQLADRLQETLRHLPAEQTNERLELAGVTLAHTAAMWAHRRRQSDAPWSDAQVGTHTRRLVAFLVAGLSAPRDDSDQFSLS